MPELMPGYDYVAITLTVKKVLHGHMTGLDTCILRDAAGREYQSLSGSVGAHFTHKNSFTGPIWVLDGAKAALIFQIPKKTKPRLLKLVYRYKQGWDGKSEDQWEMIRVQKEIKGIMLLKD
jgi:hypothetical protein